jgi:hypothetical protein
MADLIKSEKTRIKRLLKESGTSDARMKMLEPVIENVAWMKIKLDQAREKIKSSGIVMPYDNGGGQTGIRENPAFKGYEALWKSYMAGMSKLLEAMPPEVIEAEEKTEKEQAPVTVLELIRTKHKKEA